MAKSMKEKFADFLKWIGVGMIGAGGIEAAKEIAKKEALGEIKEDEGVITNGHIAMFVGFALAVLAIILENGKEEE
jgi:hypothetical protein